MDASVEVEELVLRVLRDEHGEEAVRAPDTRGNVTPFPQPADWAAGIAIAGEIRRTVESLLRDWIHQARSDGVAWAVIGESMGQPHETSIDAAVAAFTWAAPDPHWPIDPIATSWRCTTCREWVSDRGPLDLGYDSVEDGHALTCARYQPPTEPAGKPTDD